jgi:hypothetical protein
VPFSHIPVRAVPDFDPDPFLNKIVRKFPEGVVNAITKASDARLQTRPDERPNLITVPDQMNHVLLQDATAISALFHDRPLSRLGVPGDASLI